MSGDKARIRTLEVEVAELQQDARQVRALLVEIHAGEHDARHLRRRAENEGDLRAENAKHKLRQLIDSLAKRDRDRAAKALRSHLRDRR